MSLTFETLGNATVQCTVDGKPVLATDPWLVGTCYFESWALDHPLTPQQIQNVQQSEYIWISHGHPDHLHPDSLELLPRTVKLLISDHYDREIFDFLSTKGFQVEILRYRAWRRIHPELEVLCIDNENQDAILVVRFGGALVINVNDSPLSGEAGFLRHLVRHHTNNRVYVLQLCSVDADMRNFVDALGKRVLAPPEVMKPGAIAEAARGAAALGARYFCCSSSQHIYARTDSIWANDYRITYSDMLRQWNRSDVELVPPFVTVDVGAGVYVENHPSHVSDPAQITAGTGHDDWEESLTEDEWSQVDAFFRKFQLLGRHLDFIAIDVNGERRRVNISGRAGSSGITFHVPRRSLLETVKYGYFDDLLIGNFMKTELHGPAQLYPFVTPIISKIGGNAKVLDARQYRRFRLRYLRRNPAVFIARRLTNWKQYSFLPMIRKAAHSLGVFGPLKAIYRSLLVRNER